MEVVQPPSAPGTDVPSSESSTSSSKLIYIVACIAGGAVCVAVAAAVWARIRKRDTEVAAAKLQAEGKLPAGKEVVDANADMI